jgi:NAD(P)H-flavin reductase/DMSO/TMAO reductase YedYZ heme-binding membrane subunit
MTTTADFAPAGARPPRFRHIRSRPEIWLGLPWIMVFAAIVAWQFSLGVAYNSNGTTNLFLQLGRGAAYALLPLLVVMWLPVMRNGLTVLETSQTGKWLPLAAARTAHRWLGHTLMAVALLHGGSYLAYFTTMEQPFAEVLLGTQPDLVRSMRTTMHDYVTRDEDMAKVERWIATGLSHKVYDQEIHPILQQDCVKCHNPTSTRTYAAPTLPMTNYAEAVEWARSGIESRQFRINMSGIVMLLGFTAVWITSLAMMRRRRHPVFQHVHRIGYGIAALALLHIPSLHWLAAPVLVLAIELWLSRHRRLYRDRPARVTRLGPDLLRLSIARPSGMRIAPGHYVQVRIRDFGGDEWHAFSLTGPCEVEDAVTLKIKVAGDWTSRLASLVEARNEATLEVDLRGPFASPVAQALQRRDWLLIAGGIGVAPFLGLLRHVAVSSDRPRDVHIVWVLRDPAMLRWLEPVVERLARARGAHVHWHVHLTSAGEGDVVGPHGIVVHRGRPDWGSLLGWIEGHSAQPACFICGPHGMTEEVAARCRSRGWPVRTELFSG